MWWRKLLESLGRLISNLGRSVDRFYVETRMGSTRAWFLLAPSPPFPAVWNNLDIDGSGGADLRIRITPTVALPPDGFTITIERVGSGTADVSATVFIGVDDGVYPPGTPPAQMDFAFVGFEGEPGKVAPERLQVFFRQRDVGGNTEITAEISARNAQGPLRVRGGLMTSPVTLQAARGGVLGGPVTIRAGSIARATELTDVILGISLPSGGTVTIDPPIRVQAVSATTGTTVAYSAPEVLVLDADATIRSPSSSSRVRLHTGRMPASLNASVSDTEVVIHPAESLTLDVRAVGLPLPLEFTSASVQLTIPGLPLRVAWGPSPVIINVGLQSGATGAFAVRINTQLLTGSHTIETLKSPPQPRQAVVAEYVEYPAQQQDPERRELWAAVNALGHLRVTMQQTGAATSVAATLTLVDPVSDGAVSVPSRSMRLSARTANQLAADVRVSELVADSSRGGAGTLSATVDLDTGSVKAKVSGRLRHLRALYDDGAARTEAWTVATPPNLTLTYDNTDRLRFELVPDAAMAVTADRRTVVGGGLVGFDRLFARLLLNAPVRGHYGMIPRQPTVQGTAAAGSFVTVHRDAANTDFPPELVGMSLRYENGKNKGQTRAITAAATGILWTDPFEFTPSVGDMFVVVATDMLLQASDKLAHPSTRRGVSASVSAARLRDQRIATRIHPQVVQHTNSELLLAESPYSGAARDAVAARVEGILSVAIPPPIGPGQGPLAADIELDPARPRRSVRYAENRRWSVPESVRVALSPWVPSDQRLVPQVRALLADAPDSIFIRTSVSAGATPSSPVHSYSLRRSGGGGQGWIWALTEQQRRNRELAGIGVISLNLVALPQSLGLILADDLDDVRRHTAPRDVMWTWSLGWRRPSSQAITVSGDLRVERVVYASFWSGLDYPYASGTASYSGRNLDQWDLTTVTFAHLHDAGVGDQRLTIWTLDGNDWHDPDRQSGIGLETTGLNADLDLDRYRALLPPALRSYHAIPWIKQAEIQLQGYTGAWLTWSDALNPVPYERPNEDTGFWFLRAIDKLPGIGDAYFGNTPGNINGRQRLYP
jgi:hypothetical protein